MTIRWSSVAAGAALAFAGRFRPSLWLVPAGLLLGLAVYLIEEDK